MCTSCWTTPFFLFPLSFDVIKSNFNSFVSSAVFFSSSSYTGWPSSIYFYIYIFVVVKLPSSFVRIYRRPAIRRYIPSPLYYIYLLLFFLSCRLRFYVEPNRSDAAFLSLMDGLQQRWALGVVVVAVVVSRSLQHTGGIKRKANW